MPRRNPAWWARAHELRAAGLTHEQIGERLGYCADSVRHALNPGLRERRARRRRRNRALATPRTDPAWWAEQREMHQRISAVRALADAMDEIHAGATAP